MDLIKLVLGIALIGVIVWAILKYVPMEPIFKTIIYIMAAVALVFWLIKRLAGHIPNVLS